MKHYIDPAIFARYVRLHPKQWFGACALRVEFHGCFQGRVYKYDYPPLDVLINHIRIYNYDILIMTMTLTCMWASRRYHTAFCGNPIKQFRSGEY